MPIFEEDEELTPEEFKRQQEALNEKIFRLSFKKLLEEIEGGDEENEAEL